MTFALVAILVGLALADSLNPFTIAAQAYLLATPRPFPRSLAFLLGTAATVFVSGMLLLGGFGAARDTAASTLPAWGWGVGQIALGLVLAGFAWWCWARGLKGKPLTPPKSLGVPATLAFAFASAVSDLPTALPLFVAVDRVAAADLSWLSEALLIALYTVIYVAPLIMLLLVRAIFARRSDVLFGKIQLAVEWAFRVLLPPAAGLAAVYLLIDGGSRLATVI
ncbi:MAG: GAP family protein [Alphaproteobacteria bacterium]|nr:GAP family protein [Alphaproteobacteria bacterium]MBU0792596.1 GAP family protein [Alphaproteobacteria bacterium]MBU0876740.1 GAP family protein [Alphaproteobacteria bacterium]MBU1768986.1 GAP family protein [Alphaproteobacteria bacterium]